MIMIQSQSGAQIPLREVAKVYNKRGPQMIKSENSFLVGYVIFDKKTGLAETDVVEKAKQFLEDRIKDGSLIVPPGIHFTFTGNYENQVRANQKLMILIPVSLLIISLIIYWQFRSVTHTGLIFSSVLVAMSGGFIMIWLYGQDWFMSFSVAGSNIRDIFQIGTVNMSVAVWVGVIALFGIATDDSVLISIHLKQVFAGALPGTVTEIRKKVINSGLKRVRPAMMTTATTIVALLPVLSTTGKGSEIMIPIAIPTIGGMVMAVLTIFIVPVLYSLWMELKLKKSASESGESTK